MVLNWFGQKRYHERLVGQLIESCEGRGSTVENIADFFDLIGWNVEYHAGTDLKFDTIEGFEQSVIDFIDRGIPIPGGLVDWARPLAGDHRHRHLPAATPLMTMC